MIAFIKKGEEGGVSAVANPTCFKYIPLSELLWKYKPYGSYNIKAMCYNDMCVRLQTADRISKIQLKTDEKLNC